MSTTTSPVVPLVSDDDLVGWDRTQRYMANDRVTPQQVRDIYEAEVQRLRSSMEEVLGALEVAANAMSNLRGDCQGIGTGRKTVHRETVWSRTEEPLTNARSILSKYRPT